MERVQEFLRTKLMTAESEIKSFSDLVEESSKKPGNEGVWTELESLLDESNPGAFIDSLEEKHKEFSMALFNANIGEFDFDESDSEPYQGLEEGLLGEEEKESPEAKVMKRSLPPPRFNTQTKLMKTQA